MSLWGLSLAGGVGVVFGLVVRGLTLVVSLACGCLGRGGVLAPEGPRPPSVWVWGSFFLGFIHFGVGGWHSVWNFKKKILHSCLTRASKRNEKTNIL